MAEFQEVIQQKNRMCQSTECRKCDIYQLCNIYRSGGEDLSICQRFIYSNPKKAEEIIMSWAAEHPELNYPLWGEWLISIGAAHRVSTGIPVQLANGDIIDPPYEIAVNLYDRIPADIAQKLGLQPKEKIV